MSPIPLLVYFSESHEGLYRDHFRPSFDRHLAGSFVMEERRAEQLCDTGDCRSRHWERMARDKLRSVLDFVRSRPEGTLCAYSDVDVVFFGDPGNALLEELGDADIAFQEDHRCLCTGFFIARNNERVRTLLEKAIEDCRDCDQFAVNRVLPATNVSARALSGRFYSIWRQTGGELWNDDFRLTRPPRPVLMFHGNYTRGMENKRLLLTTMTTLVSGGRIPPARRLRAAAGSLARRWRRLRTPMTGLRRRLLVTGCGSSGTTYAGELLARNGIRVTHDHGLGRDGIVTNACDGREVWIYSYRRFGTREYVLMKVNVREFERVVHLVRHPLDVVASVLAKWNDWGGVWLHVKEGLGEGAPTLRAAMRYWLEWNRRLEPVASARVRFESLLEDPAAFCRLAGAPFRGRLPSGMPGASRDKRILTWEDLHREDPLLTEEIRRLASGYGYDLGVASTTRAFSTRNSNT